MTQNSIWARCELYGKELPPGHSCPANCPVAEDCQEQFEVQVELERESTEVIWFVGALAYKKRRHPYPSSAK